MSVETRRKKLAAQQDSLFPGEDIFPTPEPKVGGSGARIHRHTTYIKQAPPVGADGLPVGKKTFTRREVHFDPVEGETVSYSDFIAHVNEHVVHGVLGAPLKPSLLRMLLDGFQVEALRLANNGSPVKMGVLGTLRKVTRSARVGRDPRTGEALDIPETSTARLAVSAVARDLLAGDEEVW